jgi:predicted metal-binding membrane protein
MGLLFAAGVMNLWWVAAISGFVLLEKTASAGLRIARIAGLLLVVWGGWVLASAFL